MSAYSATLIYIRGTTSLNLFLPDVEIGRFAYVNLTDCKTDWSILHIN